MLQVRSRAQELMQARGPLASVFSNPVSTTWSKVARWLAAGCPATRMIATTPNGCDHQEECVRAIVEADEGRLNG